ncbi:MAG: LuxR C-terminal-related transcriptional regulator [Gemmatimonadaceae bacterium]
MQAAPSATKKPLRILLLEDNAADAAAISHELQQSGMRILVAQVDSAESFIAALKSFAPDVVLSDHSLAQFDSRAALEVLRDVRPAVPFIIITGALLGGQAGAAIRAGAEDVILKTSTLGLEASISNALAARRPLHALTDRQIQVLKLVTEGHRTHEIAKRLGRSTKTVESHRTEIMKRLRTHDVVSLVRYAIRVGLTPIGGDDGVSWPGATAGLQSLLTARG